MTHSSPCPSVATLSDFVKNRLPPEEASKCELHISICDACKEQVDWYEAHPILEEDDSQDDEDVLEDDLLREPFVDDVLADPSPTTSVNPELTLDVRRREEEQSFDFGLLDPSETPSSLGLLGNYEIVGVLGRGGFGFVLKGVDRTLGRFAALKILHHHLLVEPKSTVRFHREARAAARINHPNVVTVYCYDQHHGQPFIAMEYVRGNSLARRLKNEGRFDPMEAIMIGAQIAAGLAEAHSSGILHRDIKPGNLLLDSRSGRVRITDFGMARIVEEESDLTTYGRVVGTVGYIPPEIIEAGPIDYRSDLFALGCVLYEMLTGAPPFSGASELQIHWQTLDKPVKSFESHNLAISQELSDIVYQLLEKNPDDRIQTAMEVVNRLQRAMGL